MAGFALWAGRQDEAAAAIAEGLRWWAERDHDAAHPDYVRWYPLALRLEADRAERSRLEGRSDPERWRATVAAWEGMGHL